jgi:Polysaccharide biosynthesis/export protein
MPRPQVTIRWLIFLVAIVAIATGYFTSLVRRIHALQPPDLVDVNVRSALPGRPISGTRLVRPDGTISLGYYGNVRVAGLTPREARAAVVAHLRRYLSDETLGLVESVVDADGRRSVHRKLSPSDTDRVSIWMVQSNSRRTTFIDWLVRIMRLSEVMGVS